jgi:hypothetical protein
VHPYIEPAHPGFSVTTTPTSAIACDACKKQFWLPSVKAVEVPSIATFVTVAGWKQQKEISHDAPATVNLMKAFIDPTPVSPKCVLVTERDVAAAICIAYCKQFMNRQSIIVNAPRLPL